MPIVLKAGWRKLLGCKIANRCAWLLRPEPLVVGDIPQFQKGLRVSKWRWKNWSWTPGNSVHIAPVAGDYVVENGTERLGRQSILDELLEANKAYWPELR